MIYQIDQYEVKGIVNNARGLVKATDGEMSLDNAMLCVIQYDRLTHIYNELEIIAKQLTPPEQAEKERILQRFS